MPATLRVDIIGEMRANPFAMQAATNGAWEADGTNGEDLAVFAGRSCYQSFSRPNPATADTRGYLHHILEVGHESVLRHGVVTLYIQGVSRNLTHELIRHHVGMDFSQLSQRYVDAAHMDYVVPPAMRENQRLKDMLDNAWKSGLVDYEIAVRDLEAQGVKGKKAREAARAFLPGCAETKIVVTANFQAWRNFIQQRATVHADAEIRELAVLVFADLSWGFPAVFQDMHVVTSGGVQVVVSR